MKEKNDKTPNGQEAKQDLSRKAFIKGAGAIGIIGALSGAGLLTGCSEGSSPDAGEEKQNSGADEWWLPEKWDYEADVVVAGFGVAGGGAAYEALQSGASVIILEVAPEDLAGGASTAFVGYLGRFTHAAQTLVVSSLNTMDIGTAKAIEAEADRLIPLVDEAGIKWVSEPDPSMALIDGAGMEFYRAFSKTILKAGPEVHYETPAKELVFNPKTREVLGIKAEQNGKDVYVKAHKGVVLTTGSFIANKDLTNTLHLTPLVEYTNDGSPYDNGDGLKMGMQIGARLSYISMGLEWASWSYTLPSREYNTAVRAQSYMELPASDGTIQPLGGTQVPQFSRVFVNYSGVRFCNEYEGMDHDKSQMPMLKFKGKSAEMPNTYVNLPAFMVFDEAMFTAGPLGPNMLGMGWNGLRGIYNWSDDNKAELEKGWILKADTLEELASLMVVNEKPIDGAVLANTVASYNAACSEGVDTEFGRDPALLMPLGEGPYYAIEIAPCAYYTIGGLTSNADSQTLDLDDNPIQRLYHAGNIGQGSYTFPIGVSGCFGRGVLAGRHAAGLEPW